MAKIRYGISPIKRHVPSFVQTWQTVDKPVD